MCISVVNDDHCPSCSRLQWVVPAHSSQDCVVDPLSQQGSELLAVGADLRLYWYSVFEASEAGEGGEGGEMKLKVKQLATKTQNELYTELRKLDHCKSSLVQCT